MTGVNNKRIDVDTFTQFGPEDQPLLTGDGVLAFSLYMAGTPFVDENLWCINYYTADILRKLGYAGMSMREGAARAQKEGKPGVIRFMLRSPASQVATAYMDQQKEIDDGEGTAVTVLRRLLDDFKSGARSYEESVVRIVCLVLKMRIKFMNSWKDVIPLLRVDDSRQPKTSIGMDGNKVVEYGGFKFISINASEETRERMGL